MLIREACPACGSSRYKNNGHPRHGKQHHQCTACDRPLGATAEDRRISEAQRTRVEHLLRERLSRRGLCRAVGVRLPWLWHCMVQYVAACPDDLPVQLPTRPTDGGRRRLDAAADERGSFGQRKANKPWRWLAMDAITRQILAFHGGNRRRDRAKALWAKIPLVDREQATFHTEQYEAYTGVMPAERHKASTTHARKTNHIERFNNTLRQRVARLVCEALSFSKKLVNHLGAIKLFICHYNLTKAPALHG